MECIFFLTRYGPKHYLSLCYSNHTHFIKFRGTGLFIHASQQSWAQELTRRQKSLQETYKPIGISLKSVPQASHFYTNPNNYTLELWFGPIH